MTRLVVRYYSPTHCAQYVLEAQCGARFRLARDGELRLPESEEDLVLVLGSEGNEWYVQPVRGTLRTSAGRVVASRIAVIPRFQFTLGAATLVLDRAID
ncbi:MAG TPA: hypothetical protein VFQ35_07185, partial [Polyangiaceae bacterium]|nr:hypothetical protein [Polyangiaceae bacterium]